MVMRAMAVMAATLGRWWSLARCEGLRAVAVEAVEACLRRSLPLCWHLPVVAWHRRPLLPHLCLTASRMHMLTHMLLQA